MLGSMGKVAPLSSEAPP